MVKYMFIVFVLEHASFRRRKNETGRILWTKFKNGKISIISAHFSSSFKALFFF